MLVSMKLLKCQTCLLSHECCSSTETPLYQTCYIWLCHGHFQAACTDYWPALRSSDSPTLCLPGEGFHNRGSVRHLFLLCDEKKEIQLPLVTQQCCTLQRGLVGVALLHLELTLEVCSSRTWPFRPCWFFIYLFPFLKRLYIVSKC